MVTTPLTAQERVILFCSATGISYAALGITAHAMQSMAIKGIHRPPSRDRHVCAHGTADVRRSLPSLGMRG